MRSSLAIVCCIALVAACASAGRQIFTDADSGAEIALRSGDEVEIRLESNPSTGYQWVLTAMSTPGILQLQDELYVAPDTELVGAPGTQVFTFEAQKGAGILRLEYIRPFGQPRIPERVAEYIVRIDDAVWPPLDAGLDSA